MHQCNQSPRLLLLSSFSATPILDCYFLPFDASAKQQHLSARSFFKTLFLLMPFIGSSRSVSVFRKHVCLCGILQSVICQAPPSPFVFSPSADFRNCCCLAWKFASLAPETLEFVFSVFLVVCERKGNHYIAPNGPLRAAPLATGHKKRHFECVDRLAHSSFLHH